MLSLAQLHWLYDFTSQLKIQLRQKLHAAITSAIFVRSALKFDSFDIFSTFLRNIKLIISFEHQAMAKRNLIRQQLRKSSRRWHRV